LCLCRPGPPSRSGATLPSLLHPDKTSVRTRATTGGRVEDMAVAKTNTLCVHFSVEAVPVSVAAAYEELACFGEIARLEVPPAQQDVAVVSYYDVRAAARALAALSDRCAEAPQHGDRTVLLQADTQIHAWMIPEISAVRRGADGRTYSLEFFDTRVAERAAVQFFAHTTAESKDSSCETTASSKVDSSGGAVPSVGAPRYRNDLRLSQVNWVDLASGRDKRTTLRLRCLPNCLCDEEALKRALSLAGLSEVVDCIRIFPGEGKRPGSALINTVDGASAASVAKYFHGRQWGRSMPVAVSFAAVQGAVEVQRASPRATARVHGTERAAKAGPWRVETCGLASGGDEPGVSEVSTEAGDDAEHAACDAVHGEAARVQLHRTS